MKKFVISGMLKWAMLALGLYSNGTCAEPSPIAPLKVLSDHVVECSNGVVVSVCGPASDVGLSILKQGGNAVDAAVATGFAMDVAYPPSAGVGGGGFMLVHPAPGGGEPAVFDYRERAPAAASAAMYTKEESQYRQRAVAVPGTVRGFARAHRRFGSLPWAQLLQPAIALARDGFSIDSNLAKSLNETLASTLILPVNEGSSPARDYAELFRVFGKPGGGLWTTGDRLVQPDLAVTLQLLADQGPDVFYTGALAEKILAEMVAGHGLIAAQDLAGYQAIERKPLTLRLGGGYDVFVPPPPCAGGTCLLEELQMLESFDLKSWGRWSPKTLHVMAEAMRRANYDRARFLGDPAFVHIPEKLVSREYGREMAAGIDLNKATPSKVLSTDITIAPEGENTTHFSIIDHNGMAVANTFTLERKWGSRIVARNTGMLLNNDMRAFNLFPGITDTKGTIGTAPNTIAPGKRPLSSMTPAIVAKDGRVKLVTGSPGSQSIPHTILCIILNTLEFDMPVQTAVETQRFSHQWLPDQISLEEMERFPETVQALKTLGHTVVRFGPLPQGDAHTIWVMKPNSYIGVADRRISGKAAGY